MSITGFAAQQMLLSPAMSLLVSVLYHRMDQSDLRLVIVHRTLDIHIVGQQELRRRGQYSICPVDRSNTNIETSPGSLIRAR